ncbi:MAG: CehA/McbA family metallohydrolase [Bacteroidales bacterium]|nr:CehA/McbA family metallohydrolase [Bacteroidales bacterium]
MTGGKWYRGNTHTHARFSDDNDNNDVPEIAEWYKTAGYNFLCLSEHNDHLLKKQIFCHEEITESQNFIMICGLELSKTRHHTALGIDQYIGDEISLQDGVKKTIQSNGIPILNHPNDPKINASEFISTIGLNHLEVFNGGRPEDTHASEQLWDSILSMPNGRIVYAVASDDNHYNKSNVGRGWIMVRSNHLTDKSILENIRRGNFYATTGIILNNYLVSKRNVSVSSSNSDTILFIGENGKILKKAAGQNASYKFRGNEKYVRIKLTEKSGKSAWTQPVLVSKGGIRIKNLEYNN